MKFRSCDGEIFHALGRFDVFADYAKDSAIYIPGFCLSEEPEIAMSNLENFLLFLSKPNYRTELDFVLLNLELFAIFFEQKMNIYLVRSGLQAILKFEEFFLQNEWIEPE